MPAPSSPRKIFRFLRFPFVWGCTLSSLSVDFTLLILVLLINQSGQVFRQDDRFSSSVLRGQPRGPRTLGRNTHLPALPPMQFVGRAGSCASSLRPGLPARR